VGELEDLRDVAGAERLEEDAVGIVVTPERRQGLVDDIPALDPPGVALDHGLDVLRQKFPHTGGGVWCLVDLGLEPAGYAVETMPGQRVPAHAHAALLGEIDQGVRRREVIYAGCRSQLRPLEGVLRGQRVELGRQNGFDLLVLARRGRRRADRS